MLDAYCIMWAGVHLLGTMGVGMPCVPLCLLTFVKSGEKWRLLRRLATE